MQLICSGTDKGRAELYLQEKLSMREIKEIRAHIPDDLEIETFVHGAMCISYSEDVCSVISLQAGMQTMAHAPIRVAGSTLLWKKVVRESIFRSMKMKEELLFSILRICV